MSLYPSINCRGVKRQAILITKWTGRGAFKGAALVGAFLIIVAAWWWDASLLTTVADENLLLIKTVTRSLPFDWGSKIESALRIFALIALSCLSKALLSPSSSCLVSHIPSAAGAN